MSFFQAALNIGQMGKGRLILEFSPLHLNVNLDYVIKPLFSICCYITFEYIRVPEKPFRPFRHVENKYLCCSSLINPGRMQRSRAVIGLQQWLNQVAVILLKMTFHYPWAHFNCYGGDDEPGSCDEAATCKWHFILKMPNCPRRLMRGRSSPSPLAHPCSPLAHPCSHLLVFLHPFVLWFYRRARNANKAGVWQ